MPTKVLILVLLSSPAYAQMPTAHKVGLSAYAAGAALDLHSTYVVLNQGGHERNPLVSFTKDDPVRTVLIGAAADVMVTTMLYKLLGEKHPKLTTVLLVSATSVRVWCAAGNYREMR